MPQTMNPNPQLNRVEAELSARIGAVFGRFPDLSGFSLQDRTGLPDYIDPSSLRDELFVTELGVSASLSSPPVRQSPPDRSPEYPRSPCPRHGDIKMKS